QQIDLNAVPNAKTTFDFFRTAKAVNVDGKLYGVPVAWGFIPLIYNTSEVSQEPTSWEDLYDSKYKDKVSVWQDIALIYTTAIQLGYKNVYTLSDDQLSKIKAKLLELKPNIRKYWTTAGELANLMASKEAIIGMSFGGVSITQLQSENVPAREVIPSEGATSWFDNWMIPAKAPNPEAALAYINYFHQAKVQKQFAEITSYGITNENAVDLVPKDYYEAYDLGNPDFIAGLDYWKTVPRRQKYLDVLNSVVSA
ncbi:MAG: PotD/PotF family extracellular solute-binding protein, partial [Solirubrobacterales bacterium]